MSRNETQRADTARGHWRWLSLLLTCCMALTVLGGGAGRVAADASATTGDESVQAPTGWAFYHGLTPAKVSNLLGSTYRLVDLQQADDDTYTVAMVQNSGAYAVSDWSWAPHISVTNLSRSLTRHNFRLICAQRNSDGTLNAVMVSNSGAANRSWWWYTGITAAQVASHLAANNGRLVSLDADPAGGKFTVVMVANTGADAKSWWWYTGASPAQVSSHLNDNNARLVDLDVQPNGKYAVVMVAQAGSDNLAWKWFYNASPTEVYNDANDTGYRPIDITPYKRVATTKYAAIMVNDLDAEAHRVESFVESGYNQSGLSDGTYGFYVRAVDGDPWLAFRNSHEYEPASSIKALYNLYAEYQIELGNDALTNPFSYWYKPGDANNANVCPLDYADKSSNRVKTTLQDGLDRMMSVSDNRTTQGVDLRYGRSYVNAYAHILGLYGTTIHQTLGCGTKDGGYVKTTLDDLSKLYAGVWDRTLLNTDRADDFFGRMNGGSLSNSDPLATVISQEAAAQGKSGIASSFISYITAREKGGSYDICPESGACDAPYIYDRSEAGVITIPFKQDGPASNPIGVEFTYGFWVNGLRIPCKFTANCAAKMQADNTTAQFRAESLRAVVRSALGTW